MMNQRYQGKSRQETASGSSFPDPWVLLAGITAVLLFALPALVLGLVVERLTSERRWQVPLWLGLAPLGLGLTILLALHGLEAQLAVQLRELARMVGTQQWNGAHLWTVTWPVWLRTLGLIPVVALWRMLATRTSSVGAAALAAQEQRRLHAVERSHTKAARRLRHLDRLPDAVAGQMVIGVPMEDEANT